MESDNFISLHKSPAAERVEPTAEGASAVHRALEEDWARGSRLLRSLRVCALDVTASDTRAVKKFFALSELFVMEYFRCSEFLLRHLEKEKRHRLREPAMVALNQFRAAREAFVEKQGPDEVAELIDAGREARRAVVAVTAVEMGGTGVLDSLPLTSIANWFSRASAGPFLILLLARGVSAVPTKALRWAKRVLFPQTPRPTRPFCMARLTLALHEHHDSYAGDFATVERRYRRVHTRLPKFSFLFGGTAGKEDATPEEGNQQLETDTFDTLASFSSPLHESADL